MKNNMGYEGVRPSDHFLEFRAAIDAQFQKCLQEEKAVFHTTAQHKGLYQMFLNVLPAEAQQTYQCYACKCFVNHYGGLATVNEDGTLQPVLWKAKVPDFFTKAIQILAEAVCTSQITGMFFTDKETLGIQEAGGFLHLCAKVPVSHVSRNKLRTVNQLAEEKQEEYKMLCRALQEYPLSAIQQAVSLLESDRLYQSEQFLGVAVWLKELSANLEQTKGKQKRVNKLWKAVAEAPTGFCHIRAGMVGTLLDDIINGLEFDSIRRRFEEKTHPLKYQRPQAAPTAGNIEQAEKIVEKLGLQPSLERRFARLDEVQALWRPTEPAVSASGGVFSHLIPKSKKMMRLPESKITWRKFSESVLPKAKEIFYQVTEGKQMFGAILTAQHEDAPPILRWDSAEHRNPFSWYVYVEGSTCKVWDLKPGPVKVTAICNQPSMWTDSHGYQGGAVFLLLEGARDTTYKSASNGLFPIFLRRDLFEIRATIEAYSKKATISGYDNASACGLRLEEGSTWNARVQVTTEDTIADYILDRWD